MSLPDYVKKGNISAAKMGFPRSIFIGLTQGIAIIPGISRSGSTIAASIFSGIKREEAAEFSFLLSIPAILGANLISLDLFHTLNFNQLLVYLAGFLAAFVTGYLVIGFLLTLITKAKLKVLLTGVGSSLNQYHFPFAGKIMNEINALEIDNLKPKLGENFLLLGGDAYLNDLAIDHIRKHLKSRAKVDLVIIYGDEAKVPEINELLDSYSIFSRQNLFLFGMQTN